MSNPLFTLTPATITFYKKKLSEGEHLRIFTKSGCSGKKIEIEFVDENRMSDDDILEQDGIKIFYNPEDSDFLKDLEIDYVKNLVGGTIEFHNPNAKNMCGCGSSWS